jgi:hypothetical protein
MCSAAYMFGGGLNKTLSETIGQRKRDIIDEEN